MSAVRSVIGLALALLLPAAGCSGGAAPNAAREDAAGSVRASELRLIVPLYVADAPTPPELVATLNRRLADRDLVAIKGTRAVMDFARGLAPGHRIVIRQSLADLERDAGTLAAAGIAFDYLCYNPEIFPTSHTPAGEKDNPVAAARDARALADRLGVQLMIVTDSFKTLPAHGAGMAVHADLFGVQLQRWQTLPVAEFRAQAAELIAPLRQANPSLVVIGQLSTNPPAGAPGEDGAKVLAAPGVDELAERVESLADLVDGISFLLYSENGGLDRFAALLGRLRPAGPAR